MNPRELEAAASRDLSNFEGEQFEGYDGYGDDHVDFGGPRKSFASAIGSNRIFMINITNTDNTLDKIAIINNPYTTESNPAGGLIITDGVVGALTTSATPKTFANFAAFVKNNPTLVKGFKIRAKNAATQLEQQMIIKELSPFKDLESRVIAVSAYQDENTQQDKVVTVPEEILLSNQTLWYYTVMALETVSITLFCTAILNDAVTLQRKNDRAKATLEAKG